MHVKVINLSVSYSLTSIQDGFFRKKMINKLLKKNIEKKKNS